jgi:hypothetical protein
VGQKVLQQLPDAQNEVGDKLQEQLAMVVPEILHRVAPDAMGPSGQESGASSNGPGAPPASSPPRAGGAGAGP